DGAGIAHGADALDHPGAARQRAAGRLYPHDVARPGAVPVGRTDIVALSQLAVGRTDQAQAAATVGLLIEAEDLARTAAQPADDARLVGRLAAPLEVGQHAIADRGRGAAARLLRRNLDPGRRAVRLLVVAMGHGDQMALVVDAHDLQHGDVGERGGIAERLG